MEPQEKDQKILEIQKTINDIYKVLTPSRWDMFTQGLWRAFGYIVGLMLAIVIIGWFLNMIGVIPFMKEFSEKMMDVLNIASNK